MPKPATPATPAPKQKTLSEVAADSLSALFQALNEHVPTEHMPDIEQAFSAYRSALDELHEKHVEEREDEARAEGRNDGVEDGRESAREERRKRYGGIHSGQVRIDTIETLRRLENDARDPFQSRAWQAIADAVEG